MTTQDFMFLFGKVTMFAQDYEHRNEECTSLSVEADEGLLFSIKNTSEEGDSIDNYERMMKNHEEYMKEMSLLLNKATKTMTFKELREHLSQKFYGSAFDASDLED